LLLIVGVLVDQVEKHKHSLPSFRQLGVRGVDHNRRGRNADFRYLAPIASSCRFDDSLEEHQK